MVTGLHPLIAYLVRARQAAGLTQQSLADRLGVTQTAVSYWEAGKRDVSFSQLVAWAETLGVALRAASSTEPDTGPAGPSGISPTGEAVPTMPRPDGPALVYVAQGPYPHVCQVDADQFDPGGLPHWDLAVCRALLDLALTKIERHEHEVSTGVRRLEADRG